MEMQAFPRLSLVWHLAQIRKPKPTAKLVWILVGLVLGHAPLRAGAPPCKPFTFALKHGTLQVNPKSPIQEQIVQKRNTTKKSKQPFHRKDDKSILLNMSWECKYLRETFCTKRNQECNPGAAGCVLQGRFIFPLKEDNTAKTKSPSARSSKSEGIRKKKDA